MNNRDSKFELLKILAMIMIVTHHLVAKNLYNVDTEIVGVTPGKLFLQTVGNFAFIGNNLFFLVSAWFLCKKEENFSIGKTFARVWRLEKVMLFYSLGIVLTFYLLGWVSLGECANPRFLMPLSLELWWYPTAYVTFLVFYPFIQKGLRALNKEEVKCLAIVMVVLWSVTSLLPIKWGYGASSISNFLALYVIVFYIRNFVKNGIANYKLDICIIGGIALAILSIIILDLVGIKVAMAREYSCYYIRGNWRLLPFAISIAFFLRIVNLNIKQLALINWIGSSTFAIYLIHMHPFMMKYLFKELFILENWVNSWWLPVYVIGVTAIIMGTCVLIDKVRIGLFTVISRMSDALRKSKMISAL